MKSSPPISLNDNWINLKSDETFNSYDGESNKDESGSWSYSLNDKKLYINSDSGEKNDSEWFIHTTNDTLIFNEKKLLNNQGLSLRAIRIK